MPKIYLNVASRAELKNIANLKEGLELANIFNSLLFITRYLTKLNEEAESLTKDRDLIQGAILLASFLHEGIDKSNSIFKKLNEKLKAEFKSSLAWTNDEIKDNKSFYNIVLKTQSSHSGC